MLFLLFRSQTATRLGMRTHCYSGTKQDRMGQRWGTINVPRWLACHFSRQACKYTLQLSVIRAYPHKWHVIYQTVPLCPSSIFKQAPCSMSHILERRSIKHNRLSRHARKIVVPLETIQNRKIQYTKPATLLKLKQVVNQEQT